MRTRHGGRRLIVVRNAHILLPIDSALQRVDGACELNHHSITSHFKDTALALRDRRLQLVLATHFQRGQRAGLVLLDEAVIADRIGGQVRAKRRSIVGCPANHDAMTDKSCAQNGTEASLVAVRSSRCEISAKRQLTAG
jgi:hypothetical protein